MKMNMIFKLVERIITTSYSIYPRNVIPATCPSKPWRSRKAGTQFPILQKAQINHVSILGLGPRLRGDDVVAVKNFSIKFLLLSLLLLSTTLHAEEPSVQVSFNPATATIKAADITEESEPSDNKSPSSGKTGDVDNGVADVYLNFENVSLTSVVNYLSERKKINLVPHKDLEAQKVSLSTRKPLTLERAWKILLTLLEVNGFSIVQVDNLYRIVSSKDNGVEPLPYYNSQTTLPEKLPDSDLVIRYIYFFKNLKPDIAQDILKSMLEGDKSIQLLKDLQAVLIKEKCNNIKAAMKIIKELDTGGLRQAIRIVPLKEADAETVTKLFSTDIIGNSEGGDDRFRFMAADGHGESSYFSTTTKIIADASKNSLIILGTPVNIDKICNFIYKYIDVPIGSADSRIHIRELRYADAASLAGILREIIKQPGQANEKSSIVGQFKFFEDVIIKDDGGANAEAQGSGNRLIIAANGNDWARLDKFIDQLDKPTPQVAFEVMIVDISLEQAKELGTQLQTNGVVGGGLNRVQFNNLAGLDGVTPPEANKVDTKTLPAYNFNDIVAKEKRVGNTFITLGKPGVAEGNHVWALINSYFNTTNSHIVSQPFLVTNNGKECNLTVGQTVRVPGALSVSQGVNAIQEFIPKNADTEIKLTPQINDDGIVNLKVYIKSDAFGAPDPAAGPPTTRRNIDTRICMGAGEVLVLGGMTSSRQELNSYGTPLLSKIPIIGNLFSRNTKTKRETNLYVFIRPSIIKPSFDGAPGEYTQLKLDYAKYQMMKNDTYSKEYDPIQRWFFKPTNYSVKEKLFDAHNGIFRPIDDFTYGKHQPKTVDIRNDPYFTSKDTLEKNKRLGSLKSRKKHKV